MTEIPVSVTGGQPVTLDFAAVRVNRALRPTTFAVARPEPSNKVLLRVGKRGVADLYPAEARELAAQLIRGAHEIEQRGGITPRSQA